MYGNTGARVVVGGVLLSGSFYMCTTLQCILCKESCVARYKHAHLSPDFTSQEFWIEPNVSTTIQSSLSVAIQDRGDVHLSTLWEGEMAGN